MSAPAPYFSKKFVVDVLERTAATYLEVFTGLLIASKATLDISVLKTAAIAAIPSGLAVIKGILSKQLGSDQSSAAAVSVVPTSAQIKAAK